MESYLPPSRRFGSQRAFRRVSAPTHYGQQGCDVGCFRLTKSLIRRSQGWHGLDVGIYLQGV